MLSKLNVLADLSCPFPLSGTTGRRDKGGPDKEGPNKEGRRDDGGLDKGR